MTTIRTTLGLLIGFALVQLASIVHKHQTLQESTEKVLPPATLSERSEPSLRQREYEEIIVGLRWLLNPEAPSFEFRNETCSDENPPRRVLVRERLGIPNAAAEAFFESRVLPSLREKHLLLDVGANTGQFAVPMSSRGHRVISFEPSASTCDKLRENVERAGNAGRVEIHCSPADGEEKTVYFHLAPGVSSASNKQITKEKADALRKDGRGDEITETRTKTIDSVVGGRDVFLLKTDTQGYEMPVLLGAKQLMKRGTIQFLLIEFSYGLLGAAKTNPVELLEHVYSHGYMCTYLGYHTVTGKDGDRIIYSTVDAPPLERDQQSFSFDEFVNSLKVVVAPDAIGKSGWTDLFCWNRCVAT